MGDGGALLTNDEQIATRAKMLRNYGQSSSYLHDGRGLNSRLDELQAAILRDALLPNLQRWTEARRQIANRYLTGIRNSALRMLTIDDATEPVWHLFPLFVTGCDRDDLRDCLAKSHIQGGVHYPRIIPDQLALQAPNTCEITVEPANARRLASSEFSLPVHPFLEKTEAATILAACQGFKS